MDFDIKYKVVVPAVIQEGSRLVFARRGTKLVFGVTQDNKVQIQKVWTGPHAKEEIFEYPAGDVPKEAWKDQLDKEGYRIRAE